MYPVLVNVVYEVEMPSGYIFKSHVELGVTDKKIKEVTTRRQETVVNIYYEDFVDGTEYCVDLKAVKKYSVNEAAYAGVKVYDYNNKENVGVDFYKFDSDGC
ncbi:uncharacterized protein [Chironomus tepperi]|uniref:uncharacterized protein n=1 Tax=Chironomus tepperi TaxID=113505 RepID=UPI00391F4436